jgi:Apea-like HEPN
MGTLSKKQQRIIDASLTGICGPKSFVIPRTKAEFREIDTFASGLNLSNGHRVYLSSTGLEHFRNVVKTLYETDTFDGRAGFSDIWAVFRAVLERQLSNVLLSKSMQFANSGELLKLICEQVGERISNYTFVVPIFGVIFEGVDALPIASMKIVVPSISLLNEVGVIYKLTDLKYVLEDGKRYLWLTGSALGTAVVAQEKFYEKTQLIAGILAIAATTMYEKGAQFRIGVIMSPVAVSGGASWISWSDKDSHLTTHFQFDHAEQFKVDESVMQHLSEASVFSKAYRIFDSNSRTNLEEAITRSVYWYSDAHRDQVPVMQLVKYWSCVEVFFSADKKDIVKSVSVGLASVLVWGGYGTFQESEYESLKKRIAELYAFRSNAVHGASHQHVSNRDVADLSMWVAWLIISMVNFSEQGLKQVEKVKAFTSHLDETHAAKNRREDSSEK